MSNIEIIGYKRTVVGKIGGAFSRVAEVLSSSQNLAGDVNAMLVSLEASSKIMIQMHPSGKVISVMPEHDESVYGFESNPFEIAVTPVVGAARFTGATGSMIVSLEEAGATVEKMAA
jgi:hypothetical protein